MDTVYGTKKYFQSLSGASDIYRSSTLRAATNDYSYQNTLGRRSTLGAYYHMNKQPSYTNDHSLNSQYGYNTWGIWRDGRNIAPSTFSTKTHQYHNKTKSFSIILTTAAFIVLLAVISIAGLAFYFSSLKANMEDPVIGFEGSFRIAKGDLFSTGLKYNHTTTYKQKIEFYKRFVERSLTDNGLQPIRVDVSGFGDGPLIKVNFRTFLDVRKLPQNIHSVEEYIKESLFLETTALKSLYKSLRIDAESVEIKRVMDEQIVKSASLSRDSQTIPTSQTQLEKRLMKKGNNAGIGLHATSTLKPRTTSRHHSPDDEPDIDVENAPVIQGSFEGSFEITKTDADIARKKVAPTKAYASLPPKAVTPHPLRVKTKKPTIDKIATMSQRSSSMLPSTSLPSTMSNTTPTTTNRAKSSSSSSIKTTTSTTTISTTTTTTTTQKPTTTTQEPITASSSPSTAAVFVPKLDDSLFTSVPILDTQPWKPIRAAVPDAAAVPTESSSPSPSSSSSTFIPDIAQHRLGDDDHLLPFAAGKLDSFFGAGLRKPALDSSTESSNSNDMMFYHSFTNPVFQPGADEIEHLGASNMKPHPLPVPLIDDVVIPAFRPLNPTLGTNDKIPFFIKTGDEKFEHLGGGVIAKKHDNETTEDRPPSTSISAITQTKVTIVNTTPRLEVSEPEKPQGEITHTIGEFLMDLLNLPNENRNESTSEDISDKGPDSIESRIEPDSEEMVLMANDSNNKKEEDSHKKPTFMNLKEIILNRNRFEGKLSVAKTTTPKTATPTKIPSTTTTTTYEPTPTKRNRIRPNNQPTNLFDDSLLFPTHSKWEFVNGSSPNSFGHSGNMRRVFNKTLQAWVSEDVEKIENLTLNDIKTRINNATNIQDISLIFDTLASKLGITPSMSTKVPPFSHNKLKNTPKLKPTVTRTTSPSIASTIRLAATTTPSTSTFEYPVKLRESSSEVIEGEAEVEVIDPNKYDEMLKSSQLPIRSTSTEAAMKLVTLLPVRSNSGIRTYRPSQVIVHKSAMSAGGSSSSATISGSSRESSDTIANSFGDGRRIPPVETVVKGGIQVTV